MKTQASRIQKTKKIKDAIVITGVAGFLGSHLAEFYLSAGYSVIGLDNLCSGYKSNPKYLEKLASQSKIPFLFFKHDVTSPWPIKKMDSFLKKHKLKLRYVFHFASPASPPIYQRLAKETLWVNSIGTENALSFADKHKARVVFASTSEVYGDPEIHPQPESYWGRVNPWGLRSCYDEAKRFGEALISNHNRTLKKKHGWVRIFNTYGPRMNPADGRVVIHFLGQALRNQDLSVQGSGLQTRSFCYVSDLIRGISKYAESGLCEPVNIGNPKEFTILELTQVVQKLFPEKQIKVVHGPAAVDDHQKRRPDISKAQALLAWEPQIQLQEGLKLTLEWLKNQKLTDKI